jgi:hypothetical protein
MRAFLMFAALVVTVVPLSATGQDEIEASEWYRASCSVRCTVGGTHHSSVSVRAWSCGAAISVACAEALDSCLKSGGTEIGHDRRVSCTGP